MRTAYLDCSTGISGDMLLAACCDAGIAPARLEKMLKASLGLKGWRLVARHIPNGHTKALSVSVEGDTIFKSPGHMLRIIKGSRLSDKVKKKSIETLNLIVDAEARVHGVPARKVHFHELNSIDTIIDITGACLLIELLRIEQLHASAVNIGAAAPASLQMLKSNPVPVFSDTTQFELATPTGIALIAKNADHFGAMPLMNVATTGSGIGSRKNPVHQSVVKIVVGNSAFAQNGYLSDEVVQLETNIDDMDPRIYPYVMEKILQLGANDIWLTQVLMKKGRPGVVISVLCPRAREKEIVDCLMEETTTLGIRRNVLQRYILPRKIAGDKKIGYLPSGRGKIKSEYEKVVSKEHSRTVPLYKKLK